MTLRGHIEDFGLSDILQLVSKSAKTGTILLESDGDEIRLVVQGGWIVFADFPQRPGESELARRLVRAELITEDEFVRVLKEKAETDGNVADIIVRLGYASKEDMVRQATWQSMDACFEAFTWKSGTYTFDEAALPELPRWTEPVNTDFMIMNGLRLNEEWSAIQARVPGQGWRVKSVRPLPEATGRSSGVFGLGDSDVTMSAEDSVGAPERTVHALCRPGMKVAKVSGLAPMSRFETLLALSWLVERGYLALMP